MGLKIKAHLNQENKNLEIKMAVVNLTNNDDLWEVFQNGNPFEVKIFMIGNAFEQLFLELRIFHLQIRNP